VSTPPIMAAVNVKRPPMMNTYQLKRFNLGKAKSPAPIIKGTRKFPSTAGIDGIRKKKIITNQKIKPGNVNVGFASSGQASYENEYNSGIASNGLTSARHDVLHKYYAEKYPETFEPTLSGEVVYIGKYNLSDELQLSQSAQQETNTKSGATIGKLLLSPTRTYAPLMKVLLEDYFDKINGVIHCSGGGQTKCMKYLPKPFKIIKDNLFTPPDIFQIIQQNSGADDKEMYQVFNMGHRLEIFTDENTADKMISKAAGFNIDAKIIGHVEASNKKELQLKVNNAIITY